MSSCVRLYACTGIADNSIKYLIKFAESTMSGSSDVDNLFEGLQHQYTNLQIPKFKLESSFELKETLKNLGMFAAFNPNLADFSGLSQERELI